jgi:hypothetical protein
VCVKERERERVTDLFGSFGGRADVWCAPNRLSAAVSEYVVQPICGLLPAPKSTDGYHTPSMSTYE